jgi:hypothetical protein
MLKLANPIQDILAAIWELHGVACGFKVCEFVHVLRCQQQHRLRPIFICHPLFPLHPDPTGTVKLDGVDWAKTADSLYSRKAL